MAAKQNHTLIDSEEAEPEQVALNLSNKLSTFLSSKGKRTLCEALTKELGLQLVDPAELHSLGSHNLSGSSGGGNATSVAAVAAAASGKSLAAKVVRGANRLLQTPDLTARGRPTEQTPA